MAAATITFTVEGLDAAASKLKMASKSIAEASEKCLEKFGVDYLDVALRLVPVRTGYLKSTVFWRFISNLAVMVGARAGYAGYVEFGTRFMTPRSFIRPAVEKATSSFITNFLGEIERRLR